MRMVFVAALAVAVGAASVLGQGVPATRSAATRAETRPGVGAAEIVPVHRADYSDPRKAVVSFLTATDEAGLRDALVIGPEHAGEVNALLGVMGSTLRLERAAIAEFGVEGEKEFGISNERLDASLKAVEAAPMDPPNATGDSVVIKLPRDEKSGQAGGDFTVKKVNSQWKIDAASLFQLDHPKQDLPRQLRESEAIRKVTEQAIADIQAKKYNSAQDARNEYWRQSVAALDALKTAATKPAPATTRP